MAARSVFRCALATLVGVVAGEDAVALMQHFVAPRADADFAFQSLLEENQAMIEEAPQRAVRTLREMPANYVTGTVAGSREYTAAFKDAVARGWKAFYEKSHRATSADPHMLLANAKAAFLETGAFQHMRQMAMVAANASRSSTQGAVPLDSMNVGLSTSVAPWNNILKLFSVPLIKADFSMFTNFFGPDGNAARVCVNANVAVDSSYRVHLRREFSGINVWVGPAKWDNVPGWSFGTSGGFDNMRVLDVADFGWSWTLAREPETISFFYNLCVIDDEALHMGMLQTGSSVQAVEESAEIPRHGSSWVGHTWCSPDWENTPLVIPDDEVVGSTMQEEGGAGEQGSETYFKNAEDWDPESEAV